MGLVLMGMEEQQHHFAGVYLGTLRLQDFHKIELLSMAMQGDVTRAGDVMQGAVVVNSIPFQTT